MFPLFARRASVACLLPPYRALSSTRLHAPARACTCAGSPPAPPPPPRTLSASRAAGEIAHHHHHLNLAKRTECAPRRRHGVVATSAARRAPSWASLGEPKRKPERRCAEEHVLAERAEACAWQSGVGKKQSSVGKRAKRVGQVRWRNRAGRRVRALAKCVGDKLLATERVLAKACWQTGEPWQSVLAKRRPPNENRVGNASSCILRPLRP